jgi:Kdo2-lipid IVA lauroyltransferase/acyltransferase
MAKSKPLNLGFRLEALAWDAYVGGMRALGLERASRWGAGIVPIAARFASAYKTALRNLRMCFPSESDAWHEEMRAETFRELGRLSGEFPHMEKFLTKFRNGEIEYIETDPTIHFTYRPANNPIIDKYIVDTRAEFGLALQAAKGETGGMGLLRSLKKNRSVALMNDQKYNMGLAVPLFGYDCMTADGPTRLALKFNVPLVPISGRRIEGTRFRVTIHDPIPLDYDKPDAEETVYAGVKRINAFMEARILEAPAQWFWAHRRWPKEAWRKAGVM